MPHVPGRSAAESVLRGCSFAYRPPAQIRTHQANPEQPRVRLNERYYIVLKVLRDRCSVSESAKVWRAEPAGMLLCFESVACFLLYVAAVRGRTLPPQALPG